MYLDISPGNAQRTGRSLRVSKIHLDYDYDERYVRILAEDAIEDISETFGFQTGEKKVIAKVGDGPNILLASKQHRPFFAFTFKPLNLNQSSSDDRIRARRTII